VHWFLIEKYPAAQGGGHSFGIQLSRAWLILSLGILAYYIYARIAKTDGTFKPKVHAFMITLVPLILAFFAVFLTILPLLLEVLKIYRTP
jgi:hypothetical protein